MNNLIVSNLVDGKVPAGESCFASDICNLKKSACNGDGCKVCDGKTIDRPMSCGGARFFEMMFKCKG